MLPPLSAQVGTMIEVPRGALRAGDLANHAEFFSFGTNDLTQASPACLPPGVLAHRCRAAWEQGSRGKEPASRGACHTNSGRLGLPKQWGRSRFM